MRKLLNLIAIVLVLGPPQVTAQENPAALVIRLQGDVELRRGQAQAVPATVGARLLPGDEIIPAAGARAFLITRTGASQQVTQATTIGEPTGAGNPDMFDRAMRTLALAASADARTAGGRQGMIRPIPGEPALVAPRNSLLVTGTRPTFSWTAVEGATAYIVQLRDVDAAGVRPMRVQVGNVTEWTLPDTIAELTPGNEYAWTVAPTTGRPTGEQHFRVLDRTGRLELEGYIEQVTDMGLDPEGDGLFLTAMILRDMNLFYDAAAAIDKVEASGDMSADLYLLKGEILNQLGRGEEATAAFDEADTSADPVPVSSNAVDGSGHMYLLTYWQALPGQEADYDTFIREHELPYYAELVKRAPLVSYRFLAMGVGSGEFSHISISEFENWDAADDDVDPGVLSEVCQAAFAMTCEQHRAQYPPGAQMRRLVRREALLSVR